LRELTFAQQREDVGQSMLLLGRRRDRRAQGWPTCDQDQQACQYLGPLQFSGARREPEVVEDRSDDIDPGYT
jgi:hypothetical protein